MKNDTFDERREKARRVRENLEPKLVAYIPSPRLGAENFHFRRKFSKKLPALAARHAVGLPLAVNGDAHKPPVALADCFDAGRPQG